ncbi:MAG: MATE family efflux transporter [Firmicutes bacterium]|nr:MATE family efflux transporter [Bacillota bacterium]
MNDTVALNDKNPLGYEKITRLLVRFAVPAIIANLVSALYKIVDQIFIGHVIGSAGNAAIASVIPLATLTTAVSLLCGIGTTAFYNLELGRENRESAGKAVGNGIVMLGVLSVLLAIFLSVFLDSVLVAFGATDITFPLAKDYARIVLLGFPLITFTVGGSVIIRGDGSPKYAMFCVLSGAVLNVILDAVFILWLNLGIKGAGWASVIAQFVSASFTVAYFFRFKRVKLTKKHFKPDFNLMLKIAGLGASPLVNQTSLMALQIVMNNMLKKYGEASVYGAEIPQAVFAIITKINIIYLSIVIGTAQGAHPIISYNFGAGQYERVKRVLFEAFIAVSAVSIIAFLLFQIFPLQIIGIFGVKGELFNEFAVKYFRIFLMLTALNWVQPLGAHLFSGIGKPIRGVTVALTRQVIFLLPLILILPLFFGIDGVLYSGAVADFAAAIVAGSLILYEVRKMKQ